MKVRKTWFSYLLWFLFSCSLALLFYFSFTSYLHSFGIYDVKKSGLIVAVCAVVIISFVCLLEWFFAQIHNNHNEKREKIVALIGFLLIIILFFLIRVVFTPAINESAIKDSPYFQNAMILMNGTVNLTINSMDEIYTAILSVFCRFLGNRSIAVVSLQMILQFFSLIFNYIAVRKISGRFAAIISCVGFTILPIFFKNVVEVNILSLIFFVFTFLLWLLSLYKGILEKFKVRELYSIFLSFVIGYFFYYDNIFASIILIPIILCIISDFKNIRKIINIVLVILFEVIGFILPVIITACNKGTDIITYLTNFIEHRFQIEFQMSVMEKYVNYSYLIIVFALCICYIVMFFKTSHDETHIIILIAIVAVILLYCFHNTEVESYFYVLTDCFLVVAGTGLRNLFLTSEKVKDLTNMEKKEDNEESLEEFVSYFKDNVNEEMLDILENEEDSDTNIQEDKASKKEIKYIENPLPLPKKHEKKQMDYGFNPNDEQMHFDFDVTDDKSEFDI